MGLSGRASSEVSSDVQFGAVYADFLDSFWRGCRAGNFQPKKERVELLN